MTARERKALQRGSAAICIALLALSSGCRRKRSTPVTGNPTDSGEKTLVRQLQEEANGAERSTCGPASARELRDIAKEIEEHGSTGVTNGCDVFCAFVSRANGSPELLVRAITASSFKYGGIDVCDRRGQVIQRIKPFASIVKSDDYPEISMFGARCFIQVADVPTTGPAPVTDGAPVLRLTQDLADIKVRIVDVHGTASNAFRVIDAGRATPPTSRSSAGQ